MALLHLFERISVTLVVLGPVVISPHAAEPLAVAPIAFASTSSPTWVAVNSVCGIRSDSRAAGVTGGEGICISVHTRGV